MFIPAEVDYSGKFTDAYWTKSTSQWCASAQNGKQARFLI